MKEKMKKKYLLPLLLVASVTLPFFIMGYNPIKTFTDQWILSDPLLNTEVTNLHDAKSVTYLGNDTYLIEFADTNLIVRQRYTSVMNFQWEIYKKE